LSRQRSDPAFLTTERKMPDPTDSFCERCGTRYAFAGDEPKGPSLKRARVLAKGLKNYVLTDGQSLNDALASARHEDSREASSRVSEAFYRTFNFCMQCRQYACGNCWNAEAGACLSCVPLPESGVRPMPTIEPGIFAARPGPPAAAEWSLFTEEPEPAQGTEPFWATRVSPQTPGVLTPTEAAQAEPSFSEWAAEPRPEPRPEPAAPPAWPAADLLEVAAAAAASSNANNGHGPAQRQVDQQAANLWPIADQIAPEMALTPGELTIIQAQLAQAEPVESTPLAVAGETKPEALAPAQVAPETDVEPKGPAQDLQLALVAPQDDAAPPLLAHTPTWWNRRPADDDTAAEAAWSLDNPWAPDEITREPAAEPAAAEVAIADSTPSPAPAVALAAEQVPDDAAPTLPSHLLHRTLTAPDLPPLASLTPPPTGPQPGGFVARLFGRRPTDDAAGAARGASRNGLPLTDPWPHATRWSERPTESRRWNLETETPQAETWTANTPIQDVTPEYVEAPAAATAAVGRPAVATSLPAAPAAPAARHADIDPRSAAALRLNAVESGGSYAAPDKEPANTISLAAEATPDAAAAVQADDMLFDRPAATPAPRRGQEYEPAWIRVQREAAESASQAHGNIELVAGRAAPAASQPAPSIPASGGPAAPQVAPAAQETPAPESPSTKPATAWPPLGASWPSREDPTAPWAAPEAPVVPAAVAATRIPTPTIAEMWAQSSQEVMNRGTVRVCSNCALPVSTQARFCRRCGTAQG
jgi:hypothetical protein